ncbi:MAG: nucleoside-diphosphate kinase [Candidatus Hadarchaeales archaeon]
MSERTFAMIKPEGVARNLVDEIFRRIEKSGLKIVEKKKVLLDRERAQELYSVHRGKEFFERLVESVTSGEVVGMIIEGEVAVKKMRELIGPTDPAKAPKGTIRGDFGESITKNIIHAADSPENAEREAKIFFGHELWSK